ncbi:hypothetical protein BB558_004992 [Smittium angustum]|uniref:Uncharacterized protein n=1 Tax=Smittium angustum TaxID=133377 RepID=A0A2U1J1Q4_SMIAN|nr:hypothetical protein BB558_004992 [Smittium angustum]
MLTTSVDLPSSQLSDKDLQTQIHEYPLFSQENQTLNIYSPNDQSSSPLINFTQLLAARNSSFIQKSSPPKLDPQSNSSFSQLKRKRLQLALSKPKKHKSSPSLPSFFPPSLSQDNDWSQILSLISPQSSSTFPIPLLEDIISHYKHNPKVRAYIRTLPVSLWSTTFSRDPEINLQLYDFDNQIPQNTSQSDNNINNNWWYYLKSFSTQSPTPTSHKIISQLISENGISNKNIVSRFKLALDIQRVNQEPITASQTYLVIEQLLKNIRQLYLDNNFVLETLELLYSIQNSASQQLTDDHIKSIATKIDSELSILVFEIVNKLSDFSEKANLVSSNQERNEFSIKWPQDSMNHSLKEIQILIKLLSFWENTVLCVTSHIRYSKLLRYTISLLGAPYRAIVSGSLLLLSHLLLQPLTPHDILPSQISTMNSNSHNYPLTKLMSAKLFDSSHFQRTIKLVSDLLFTCSFNTDEGPEKAQNPGSEKKSQENAEKQKLLELKESKSVLMDISSFFEQLVKRKETTELLGTYPLQSSVLTHLLCQIPMEKHIFYPALVIFNSLFTAGKLYNSLNIYKSLYGSSDETQKSLDPSNCASSEMIDLILGSLEDHPFTRTTPIYLRFGPETSQSSSEPRLFPGSSALESQGGWWLESAESRKQVSVFVSNVLEWKGPSLLFDQLKDQENGTESLAKDIALVAGGLIEPFLKLKSHLYVSEAESFYSEVIQDIFWTAVPLLEFIYCLATNSKSFAAAWAWWVNKLGLPVTESVDNNSIPLQILEKFLSPEDQKSRINFLSKLITPPDSSINWEIDSFSHSEDSNTNFIENGVFVNSPSYTQKHEIMVKLAGIRVYSEFINTFLESILVLEKYDNKKMGEINEIYSRCKAMDTEFGFFPYPPLSAFGSLRNSFIQHYQLGEFEPKKTEDTESNHKSSSKTNAVIDSDKNDGNNRYYCYLKSKNRNNQKNWILWVNSLENKEMERLGSIKSVGDYYEQELTDLQSLLDQQQTIQENTKNHLDQTLSELDMAINEKRLLETELDEIKRESENRMELLQICQDSLTEKTEEVLRLDNLCSNLKEMSKDNLEKLELVSMENAEQKRKLEEMVSSHNESVTKASKTIQELDDSNRELRADLASSKLQIEELKAINTKLMESLSKEESENKKHSTNLRRFCELSETLFNHATSVNLGHEDIGVPNSLDT